MVHIHHHVNSRNAAPAEKMKQEVRLKHLTSIARGSIEALVASLAQEYLQRHFQPADLSTARLVANFEKMPARQIFRVTLRLEQWGRIFFYRDEDDDIESAAVNAFAGLGARVRRHLARQRHRSHQFAAGSTQRLTGLGQRLPLSSHSDHRAFFDQVRQSLEQLANFIERELLYLRASGELASDYPTVDDVVDEVLVRSLEFWQSDSGTAVSESVLLQLSISVLAERVAESKTELLEGLAVDESAETDPAHALYAQEQLAEPDPERFDSLISVPAASDPAEAADADKIRRLLFEALRRLPSSWRRMVILAQMDDVPIPVVAATLDVDEQTVQACLDHADAFLRSQLQQAEMNLADDSAPADYLVIESPFSPVASEIERELSELLRARTRSLSVSDDN